MGSRVSPNLARVVAAVLGAERTYRQGIERNTLRIIAPVRRGAAKYPAKRRGQTYVRTLRLKRGWTEGIPNVQSLPGRVAITQVNTTEYTPEVQEAGEQKPIFRKRWKTLDKIGVEAEPLTALEVDRALTNTRIV